MSFARKRVSTALERPDRRGRKGVGARNQACSRSSAIPANEARWRIWHGLGLAKLSPPPHADKPRRRARIPTGARKPEGGRCLAAGPAKGASGDLAP